MKLYPEKLSWDKGGVNNNENRTTEKSCQQDH